MQYIDHVTLWSSFSCIDITYPTSHPSTSLHPRSLALNKFHPCNFQYPIFQLVHYNAIKYLKYIILDKTKFERHQAYLVYIWIANTYTSIVFKHLLNELQKF